MDLENDHLPFDTVKRVHNCAWKVYGNKIEELSSTVTDYYFEISRTYWLKDYTKIIQNDYSFDFVSKKPMENITGGIDETYDILYLKFYTYEFFTSVIKRYVYEYEDKWELIESHYLNFKKYVFNQLVEHIEENKSSNNSV